MTTLSSTKQRASKPHRCDQCGQMIVVGERYLREVGTWDGFQVYRSHPECDRAARGLHRMAHLLPDEGVNLACDLTTDDTDWLAEYHPAVAVRFGLVLTPYF